MIDETFFDDLYDLFNIFDNIDVEEIGFAVGDPIADFVGVIEKALLSVVNLRPTDIPGDVYDGFISLLGKVAS